MNRILKPHDLVRLRHDAHVMIEDASQQDFAASCIACTPFAVIRRMLSRDGLVPVGLRGGQRHQRYAAWVNTSDIERLYCPEMLRSRDDLPPLPAFHALARLEQRWRELQLRWGPIGSVGFALAAGVSAVTETSDLDVLLRAPTRLPQEQVQQLARSLDDLPCRVDVQVETNCGYVALGELASRQTQVLLRTCRGVELVSDAWNETEMSSMSAILSPFARATTPCPERPL